MVDVDDDANFTKVSCGVTEHTCIQRLKSNEKKDFHHLQEKA